MRTAPLLRALLAGGVALAGTAAAMAQGAPLVPGPHDALRTAGAQATQIGGLWNLYQVVCGVVFAAVLLAFALAVWSRSGRADERSAPDLSHNDRHEPGPYRSVVAGVAVSVALLLVLLVATVWTDRALARLPLENAVRLEVTGHQWWWDIRYQAETPADAVTTANEIHVPVGRPVVVRLRAGDVIHSLWVPSLAGKKDLIPGRTSELVFRADKPGLYRGQCAEFCGFQHAFMAFEVIAEPPDRFDAWLVRQRQPASEPSDATARRGKDVFMGSTCIMCHAIQGTDAGARTGPDLTHVGSRTTIASGTLPNDADSLKRWIRDPQKVKPGTNMPSSTLPDADLDAVVAYLRGLS